MEAAKGRKRKAGDCYAAPDDYLPRSKVTKAARAVATLQSISVAPIAAADPAVAESRSIRTAPRTRLLDKTKPSKAPVALVPPDICAKGVSAHSVSSASSSSTLQGPQVHALAPDSSSSPPDLNMVPADSYVGVPPDGNCLPYCIVAGRNLAKFIATPRDDDGVPRSAHKDVALADLVEARRIVDDVILRMGSACHDAGYARLLGGQMPEGADVEYYAQYIGGRIRVVPLGIMITRGPRIMGAAT